MSFFKSRENGAEQSGPSPAPVSLETLRQRARHRLIGASALVLIGVVGFPLLFDSQPRPIAVDIGIQIPDKATAAPLSAVPADTAPQAQTAEASPAPDSQASSVSAPSTVAATPHTVKPAASAVAASPARSAILPKLEAKPEPKAEGKAPPKTENKTSPGNKAQALLEGKELPPHVAPAAARYAVQVGAFADAQKAHEARTVLEKAGIKTYTQVVTTADGRRTRVRAGPWSDRAEAEKAAEKIKKLNLSVTVLTL